jgi:virulence factor Mce-like protein
MSPAPRQQPTTTKRRRRGIHPLAIALLTILGVVFVTFYAFNQGLPFVHKYTMYALTNNSVNVRADSPVRIAGIDVGSVEGVTPGPGQTSRIKFTMNQNGLPVHTDATIRIRDRLFLEGGYYLDLDPGSPSAPVTHDGFTIPLSNTSSVVQFYKVLSTFDIATRRSLENILNTFNEGFSAAPGKPLSASGAGGLKAAVPQFTPVFKDTAYITRALRGTQAGDVERLLSSASDVTTTLAHNAGQLADLVTGLNRASSALAAADGSLAQSISGFDQTLRVTPAALVAIDRALPPLAALGEALDPSLRVAPPLIDEITVAVHELGAIVAPAERAKLLTSVKATFEEFPTLLKKLSAAFPIGKQVTDCLSTHVTPILKSVVPDGSLSTGLPVWQDFVHFLPNIASASGDFGADGPYTRVLIGAGTNTLVLPNIPGIGSLVGSAPPGGGSVQGARPTWIGALTPSDFRPDVKCSTQKVPSLAAPTAASDARSVRSSTEPVGVVSHVVSEFRRAEKAAHAK